SAKSAFQVTYKERFGLEWETRETTVSEQWTYEVKTYETFEEVEEVEEIVEETEVVTIIDQCEIVVQEQSEHVEITEGEEVIKVVTEESTESSEIRKVTGAVITGNIAATMRHGTPMVQSDSVSRGEESSASSS
ncbi:hypothetical protein BGZ59_005657, partial [Podila verticillata]